MAEVIISAGVIKTGSSFGLSTDIINVYGTTRKFSITGGASLNVKSGGNTSGTKINQKSKETIEANGSAIGTIISGDGATQMLQPGAVAISTVINSGGIVDNYACGTTSGVIINSGGVMATYGRDSPVGPWESFSYDTIINAGGIEYVGSNALNRRGEYSESYNAKIYGSQFVTNRANASNAIIYSGGSQEVSVQGAAVDTQISSGGSLKVAGGGFAENTIVSSGGNLVVSDGGILWGASLYDGNGSMTTRSTVEVSSCGDLVVSSGGGDKRQSCIA